MESVSFTCAEHARIDGTTSEVYTHNVCGKVVVKLDVEWSAVVFLLAFVGAFISKLASTLAIDCAKALESAVLKLVERSKQKKGDDRKGKRPPRR